MIATDTRTTLDTRKWVRIFVTYTDNDSSDSWTGTSTSLNENLTMGSTGIQTYIPPYEKIYPQVYPELTPTHRVKNPFEGDIFNSIINKHSVIFKNRQRNITFKRQL